MVCNSFRIQSTLRVILLTVTLFLLSVLFTLGNYPVTCLLLVIFAVGQFVALLRYVNTSNQLLNHAFTAILHDDFTAVMDSGLRDTAFGPLQQSINDLIRKLQEGRLEREQQFRHLQAIVQQAGIGLISVRQDETVNLVNKFAEKMLQLTRLNSLTELASAHPDLAEVLRTMRSDERCDYVFDFSGVQSRIAVYVKDIRLHGEQFRLITLQNIQRQLEEKEMEAWHDLMHILSHEIMNSVTPIASLATTVNMMLGDGPQVSAGNVGDIRQAVQTIEKRSQGLMQFINKYRYLAKVPQPKPAIIQVAAFLQRLQHLVQPELDNLQIQLNMSVEPPNLRLQFDPALIEQVLLNLLANAMAATGESRKPQIEIVAGRAEDRGGFITVSDNGCGIEPHVLGKVFVPFFSTKKNGSGIGLSLSRQIMQLHDGTIEVKSKTKSGTAVTLSFAAMIDC